MMVGSCRHRLLKAFFGVLVVTAFHSLLLTLDFYRGSCSPVEQWSDTPTNSTVNNRQKIVQTQSGPCSKEKMETRRRNSLSRVICQTQEVPDPVQNDIEMGAVQSLEESLPTRCNHRVCQMRCGNASNFTVPLPPSGTLLSIHQAAAIWCALDLESTRLKRPANLLVWGLGNDSPFWAKSTSGRVAFIEGNSEWFSKIEGSNPGLEQYLVKYDSKIQRDLPRLGTQELEKEMNHILDDLPLHETIWDVFLVDAPNGCSKSDVGRFASAYTSRRLAVMQGHGHIFVDDYQRTPDRRISDFVLDASQECKESTNDAEKNCGQRVAIWNRLHPASRKYIEKLAMFSFGASATKESLDAMCLVEGATRCGSIKMSKSSEHHHGCGLNKSTLRD